MKSQSQLWRQGLEEKYPMRFHCLGSSMLPILRSGDCVTILPDKSCQIGNIVLYASGDNWFLHRIIAKSGRELITQGDSLSHFDPPITCQDIWGRAIMYERRGKRRSLETWYSRLGGLAFSLTISRIPKPMILLAAVRRFGRDKLGLSLSHKGES
jgi:hypothetical protein